MDGAFQTSPQARVKKQVREENKSDHSCEYATIRGVEGDTYSKSESFAELSYVHGIEHERDREREKGLTTRQMKLMD